MKKSMLKPVCAALGAVLVLTSVGVTVYAGMNDKKQDNAVLTVASAETSTSGQESTEKVERNGETGKEETVYVLAGADGSVQKLIVCDWLKNGKGSDSLSDVSQLTDIENVKGDETYSLGQNHGLVWDAKGNDIYYQGTIEKELPVSMKISYTLDGKEMTPEELKGKSGHVVIRFTYENKEERTIEVNGKKETVHVPFAMLTGMLLDNDVFTDIEVSNGKIVNDGSRTAVIGIAFPGLSGDLKLEEVKDALEKSDLGKKDADEVSKLEIPDYVEVSADVENFSMSATMTIATNEVFNGLDTDKLDSLDGITDAVDQLTDGMNQLLDGSSQLYDGLCTLLEKSGELVKGINQLADGSASLKEGAAQLSNGTSALYNGAKQLDDGLGLLSNNSASLNAGARQVFESLLATVNSQLAQAGVSVPTLTVENYAQVLNELIASLDTEKIAEQARAVALEKVTAAVNAQRDTIQAAVEQAVYAQVQEGVRTAAEENVFNQILASIEATKGMNRETYETAVAAGLIPEELQQAIKAALDARMNSDAIKALIASNTEQKMQSEEIKALIVSKTEEQVQALIEQNMNSPEVQEQITQALQQAQSGAATISALKGQLDSYTQFYTGLRSYTAGVDQANSGAASVLQGISQVRDGAGSLAEGSAALADGIQTMKKSAPALVDGVEKLKDGAMQLSDGLKEFNEKGIQKITEALDGDYEGLADRIRGIAQVSREYKSFSGIADGMDGQVKFIYRTEE